ncbi:MAG: DNA-3-methyladenine glycosylase [Candidatus Limnocylindrales bacterium]
MTVVAAETSSDAERGPPPEPLGRSFFQRPVDELAIALLGTRLVRRWSDGAVSCGRIVEVEAYGGPEDRASHARSGATARNATMFGPAGHAYVYRVYGMHACLNIVGGASGEVGAVLVRAAMPEGDPSALRARRDRPDRSPLELARLASGPGNLGRAFGIDLDLDGADLTDVGSLWLEASATLTASIVRGPRIGVGYAGPGWAELPRRFGIRRHPALSRPFPVDA